MEFRNLSYIYNQALVARLSSEDFFCNNTSKKPKNKFTCCILLYPILFRISVNQQIYQGQNNQLSENTDMYLLKNS